MIKWVLVLFFGVNFSADFRVVFYTQILQDRETDCQFAMTKIDRLKRFVTSLKTDTKYAKFYKKANKNAGPS